jgi:hypothetical protein
MSNNVKAENEREGESEKEERKEGVRLTYYIYIL